MSSKADAQTTSKTFLQHKNRQLKTQFQFYYPSQSKIVINRGSLQNLDVCDPNTYAQNTNLLNKHNIESQKRRNYSSLVESFTNEQTKVKSFVKKDIEFKKSYKTLKKDLEKMNHTKSVIKSQIYNDEKESLHGSLDLSNKNQEIRHSAVSTKMSANNETNQQSNTTLMKATKWGTFYKSNHLTKELFQTKGQSEFNSLQVHSSLPSLPIISENNQNNPSQRIDRNSVQILLPIDNSMTSIDSIANSDFQNTPAVHRHKNKSFVNKEIDYYGFNSYQTSINFHSNSVNLKPVDWTSGNHETLWHVRDQNGRIINKDSKKMATHIRSQSLLDFKERHNHREKERVQFEQRTILNKQGSNQYLPESSAIEYSEQLPESNKKLTFFKGQQKPIGHIRFSSESDKKTDQFAESVYQNFGLKSKQSKISSRIQQEQQKVQKNTQPKFEYQNVPPKLQSKLIVTSQKSHNSQVKIEKVAQLKIVHSDALASKDFKFDDKKLQKIITSVKDQVSKHDKSIAEKLMDRDSLYQFWDNEYSKQINRTFKQEVKKTEAETIFDATAKEQTTSEKERLMDEEPKLARKSSLKTDSGMSYLDSDKVEESQVQQCIRRLERIFGKFGSNREQILKIIEQKDSQENEQVYQYLETHFRDEFVAQVNKFLAMNFEDYVRHIRNVEQFGDRPESEFSVRQPPSKVAIKSFGKSYAERMNFAFDGTRFEARLSQVGLRVDDLVTSYRGDPNFKKHVTIGRLEGERYRTELCMRLGITNEQLHKLFITKLDVEQKQKLLKLREQGKVVIHDRTEKIKADKERLKIIQKELQFDNFELHNNDNYVPQDFKGSLETQFEVQKRTAQTLKLKKQKNILSKKKQALTDRSANLMERGIRNIMNDPKIKRMFKTVTAGIHFEREKIDRKIINYRELCDFRIDPTKYTRGLKQDSDDIIDKNLVMILNDDELHNNITIGIQNQKKYEMIVNNANKIMVGLKQKTNKAIEAELKEIAANKTEAIAQFFVAAASAENAQEAKDAKIAFLVQKFISKLKTNVQNKKSTEIKQQQDKFVEDLLKKVNYRQGMKQMTATKKEVNKAKKQKIEIKQAQMLQKLSATLVEQIMSNSKNNGNSNLQSYMHSSAASQIDESEIPLNADLAAVQKQIIPEQVQREFIAESLNQSIYPLPILQKINQKTQELWLINYKINEVHALSFANALIQLIPKQVQKLLLMDNKLEDKHIAEIFNCLAQVQNGGLNQLAILQNEIGDQSAQEIEEFMSSESAGELKKLVIKNPITKFCKLSFKEITGGMLKHVQNLQSLKQLQLSQLHLSSDAVVNLAMCIRALPTFEHLNLSNAGLNGNSIYLLLSSIHKLNQLRSLNLSENILRQFLPPTQKSDDYGAEGNVISMLSEFIHFNTLLHLDIGNIDFNFEQLKHFVLRGLRKSRTLQSCHMTGVLSFLPNQNQEIIDLLKVKQDIFQYSTVKKGSTKFMNTFKPISQNALANQIWKDKNKEREKKKNILEAPSMTSKHDERIIFERVLGRIELPGSSRWRLSNEESCRLCNKQTYCLVVWNYQLEKEGSDFYYHARNTYPFEFTQGFKYQNPVISVNNNIQYLMPLSEFMDRLEISRKQGYYNFRSSDNFQDQKNYQRLESFIEGQIQEGKYDPTFWEETQKIMRNKAQVQALSEEIKKDIQKRLMMKFQYALQNKNKKKKQDKEEVLPEEPPKFVNNVRSLPNHLQKYAFWDQRLSKFIPNGFYSPIDNDKYAEEIRQCYIKMFPFKEDPDLPEEINLKNKEGNDILRVEAMAKETFLACCFLPCHHDYSKVGKKVEVMIQHPDFPDKVDFMVENEIKPTSENKHLSINTMRISYKQIKKVTQLREFSRPKSVFWDWNIDTQVSLQKAFETDAQFLKLHKFIKDPIDLQNTLNVLQKYYYQLRLQYVNQISTPKNYPTITWLEFSSLANTWGIIGNGLSQTDVDRIFIATNFEEVDLDNNDDSNLCRYEYIEIIVRLAKAKFMENTKEISHHYQATEKMITDFILPNSAEQMVWQPFREQRLWNLECDDLYKANKTSLDKIYQWCKKGKMSKDHGCVAMIDLINLMGMIELTGTEMEKKTALAFGLSKMSLIDEMVEFDNYNNMKKVEFYEFIGRMSELLYPGEYTPLVKKIERLLGQLIKVICKSEMVIPSNDDGIESESDCDDELVEDFISKAYETKLENEEEQRRLELLALKDSNMATAEEELERPTQGQKGTRNKKGASSTKSKKKK